MRLKLIACKALSRELSYLASLSKNIIDITWMRQGLHETPERLNAVLKDELKIFESGEDEHTNVVLEGGMDHHFDFEFKYDAVLIGYGLCSNGVVGLKSQKHTLVIPRAHDCITFFLGSKEKYNNLFKKFPGCFWYTSSWIENCMMPCEETQNKEREYFRNNGYDDEDDLDFLMETLQGWTKSYKNAVYIKMPFYNDPEEEKFTEDAADYFGWNFNCIDGDLSLLKRFLDGDWDEKDFLIVPPGYTVYATNDSRIIDCHKSE